MSQISYYTKEGLQKLKDELHHMKTVERPKISQQIGEAIDKGDLSVKEICKLYNITKPTLYRYLKKETGEKDKSKKRETIT